MLRLKHPRPQDTFSLGVCNFEHLCGGRGFYNSLKTRLLTLMAQGLALSQTTAPHFLVGRSV